MNYATSDGTAVAGSDYTVSAGHRTWAPGETAAKSFSVPITSDRLNETDETFQVTLSKPIGGAVLGSPAAAVVTIRDDDSNSSGAVHHNPGPFVPSGRGPSKRAL